MPQSVEHHRNAVFTAMPTPSAQMLTSFERFSLAGVSNRVPAVKTTRSASAALGNGLAVALRQRGCAVFAMERTRRILSKGASS